MFVFALAVSTVLHPVSAQPAGLRFDSEISRPIQHDEEHIYTLESDANQPVDIEVVQQGINIGVTVVAPDGTVLAAGDNQRHVHAVERISFDAAEGGTHRIHIASVSYEGFRDRPFNGFNEGASSSTFSESDKPEHTKFMILVEKTIDGVKLSCVKGCAFKVLIFRLEDNIPQAIDQFGMSSLKRDKPERDSNLANFLFIIKKAKEGFSLEGLEGTTWKELSFSCSETCHQIIKDTGLTLTDGNTPFNEVNK